MPEVVSFDWSTFWLLAAITLAEGFRRVPEGAFLLRHPVGYPWQVAGGPYRQGWRLVSWFSPFVLTALLQPKAGPAGGLAHPERLRRWVAVLRIPSALALAALLVGVPFLTATVGVRGLIYALALAFGTALLTAAIGVLALRRLGIRFGSAVAACGGILSPFTAPRAPEIVLERALAETDVVHALKAILPAEAFRAWARPYAFDLLHGEQPVEASPLGTVPREEWEGLVDTPPAGVAEGERYCPRCGGIYLPALRMCGACDDVELEPVAGEIRAEEPVVVG